MSIKKLRIIFLFSFLAIIISGIFYIRYVWNKNITQDLEQSLMFAKISETGLNGEMFKQLKGEPEDVGTTAYESIKKRLINLVKIEGKIHFAYIYTKKSDKIYFLADSEPVDSANYSPPGQEYTEADEQYKMPFLNGQALITKPVADRWGTWISILVPMKDSETGEIKAVFALDYPAKEWNTEAIYKTTQSGIIFSFLLLLFFAFYLIIKNYIKIKESEEKFSAFSKSVKDAVVIMDGDDLVVLWNKTAEDMFGYSESEMLGKEFHKYISVKKEHENKDNILKFVRTGESAVLDKLIELPVKNKEGKEFMVELSVSRVLINNKWHAIGMMRDITLRKQTDEILKRSAEEKEKALVEAEKLNKLMVGREMEMIELKKQLENFKNNNH